MKKPVNIIFMGKGGVGKSTSAALNSVFLSEKGHRVLMASFDPAHNLSDIFERRFSDEPTKISPNFSGVEIDQEKWIGVYLKDVQKQINRTYRYLTALNLEKYFKVIKHSPGLEEYALMLAFKHIRQKFSDYDYLIFDMPPTALSLRFLSLPFLSLIWIEHLLALRREIIEKRDLITKIKIGKKVVERDKVLNKIKEMTSDFQSMKALFEDPDQTHIHLVLNPDKLSHAESLRILHALKEIHVQAYRVVHNKMPAGSACADIDSAFAGIPVLNFPHSEVPLIGYDRLRKFLQDNDDVVEKQLDVCYLTG
jgi:arsenite/tail-anchored protein-transporting ATPase